MVMSELSPARVAKAIQRHVTQGVTQGGDVTRVAEALNFEVKGLALQRAPEEADLPLEELRSVLRYWQALPKVAGVADTMRIDPADLRGALGYLMLVDAGPGEDDFRYALYGSKIAAVSGFDMTGKTVWQVATASAIQVFFAACYRDVRGLRCPLYTVHTAPPQITASNWHRLILPLGEGGEVRRFLVCNTPIQDGRLV